MVHAGSPSGGKKSSSSGSSTSQKNLISSFAKQMGVSEAELKKALGGMKFDRPLGAGTKRVPKARWQRSMAKGRATYNRRKRAGTARGKASTRRRKR